LPRDWDTFIVFDEGFYDCTEGTCPNGHRHVRRGRKRPSPTSGRPGNLSPAGRHV